jgi:hypothetical protein
LRGGFSSFFEFQGRIFFMSTGEDFIKLREDGEDQISKVG